MSKPVESGNSVPADPAEAGSTVQLLEEQAYLTKQVVTTGKVRVITHSDYVERLAEATLHGETVEVTRVEIGQQVTGDLPQIRTEGDLTIVPILEEVMVVEKRLVLKEELHIRKRATIERVEVPITLRRQTAEIERDPKV